MKKVFYSFAIVGFLALGFFGLVDTLETAINFCLNATRWFSILAFIGYIFILAAEICSVILVIRYIKEVNKEDNANRI